MAKKIDTIERDGRKLSVYDNGMELDAVTGKIVTRPPSVAFTPEKARAALRKRQEKMQRLTRARLVETHNSLMPNPVKTSAAAFAEALAMLWEQVVLNSEAYPRDRKEVLEMVAKYAALAPVKEEEGELTAAARLNAYAAGMGVETARTMVKVLGDVKKLHQQQGLDRPPDVIEGKTIA